MVKLAIIIVNYHSESLIAEAIKDIANHELLEIIVVSNGTTDDNKAQLLTQYHQLKWVESGGNVGFGRANNIGVAHTEASFILFLNPDTIFKQEALVQLFQWLTNNEGKRFILGCAIKYPNGDKQKSVYTSAGEYIEPFRQNYLLQKLGLVKLDKDTTEIQALMGAFMLMKREDFLILGGFDPNFFMYAEEVDLCQRAIKNGISLLYTDMFSVTHIYEGTQKTINNTFQRKLSGYLLIRKIKGNRFSPIIFLGIDLFSTLVQLPVYLFYTDDGKKKIIQNIKFMRKLLHWMPALTAKNINNYFFKAN